MPDLVTLHENLAKVVLVGRDLTQVLTDITHAALPQIPGAEAASITLIRKTRADTAAYVGQMALDADELQYARGHGPCLQAGEGGQVLIVDDMRTEQRWPDYTANVLGVGVRSSLSMPLPYQGSSIGALNIYSTEPAAFASQASEEAATAVAEAVAVAVANADAHDRLAEHAQNMRLAMESRAVIEQAKGVLMAQQGIDAEQAFEVLRGASQRYNRKLRDIAHGIVEGTQRR
jgi:GAF domain-containing protein